MSDHDLVSLFHRQWDLRYELSSHFLQKVKCVSMLDGDAGSVDTLRAMHEAIGVFLHQIEADCNIHDDEEDSSFGFRVTERDGRKRSMQMKEG